MWEKLKLADVCTLRNGRAYKKPELLAEGKYRVLRVGNFFTSKNWYYSDLELDDTKYCDNGDLLYAWSASFGARLWEGEKVIYHYHIWRVDINEEIIDKRFLFYWFEFDKELIKLASGTGTTMMHVSKSSMEKREIHLPPLAEQQRIVAKLDAAFAEIDGAIATCKQQIFKMECLNQRVVDEAFNNESEHLEFDSIVREKGTGLERRANLQSPNNPFPYLKMNNISAKNRLYISKYTTVDASEEELKKYTLNDGDFLFNTRNSVELVGKTAVVSGLDGWLFNNNILRVKFIEGVNADYINFFFGTSFGKRQLNLRKTGTINVAAIYYKDLKTIEIPTINEVEQLQIVKKLKAAETEAISFIENINDKIANLLNLKSAILAQELQSEAA